jgi:hypothetical protein
LAVRTVDVSRHALAVADRRRSTMLKKLFITAAAAAAVSVPFAGAAWAEPQSDPSSTDTGIGKGGMPEKLGNFVATGVTPSAGTGDPIPPGHEFNLAKDTHDLLHPGVRASGPVATGEFESLLWSSHTLADGTVIPSDPNEWGNVLPGLAIKTLTPGCDKGAVCRTRLFSCEVRRLRRVIRAE